MLTRTLVLAAVAALATAAPGGAQQPNDLPPPLNPGDLPNDLPARPDRPPPQALDQPVRLRQALVPGATYEARLKGTMNFDGVDERMGPLVQAKGKIRISYAFEAVIERTIVENDGTRIVEDRFFKLVRTAELGSTAHNFELQPGPAGSLLLEVLSAVPIGGQVRLVISIIQAIANKGGGADKLIALSNQGFKFAGVGKVDGLTGKAVRITYEDGRGVIALKPLKGEMTEEERDFHRNSVVISDCLVFPDVNVPVGGRYKVPGANFGSVIDPTLLADVGGEVSVRRRPDATRDVPRPDGGTRALACVTLECYDGRLEFRSGERVDVKQFGSFEPTGVLYYDPAQHLVVEARLSGTGEFTRIPPKHLLQNVKQFGTPTTELVYSCRRVDRAGPPRPGDDDPTFDLPSPRPPR